MVSCPSRAFYVRKRWDGERLYLIHLTTLVAIDHFSEAVWDLLDGTRGVDEITAALNERFPQLEASVCLALVALNIMVFEQSYFLQSSTGDGDESRSRVP